MNRTFITVALLGMAVAGCAVGPDYVRPDAPVSAQYKEAKDWRQAEPRDQVPRGKWWEAFRDPVLDDLEEQVAVSNQNVRYYEALYRQSAAQARVSNAALYPTVGANASKTRGKASTSVGSTGSVTTDHSLELTMSWEADIWGKLRRAAESTDASAVASAADLESATLSAQATLAEDYFLLRVADEQQRLYDATLTAYEREVKILQNQYAAGTASKADVANAVTLLKATQATALDVSIQRAQYEHAIAVLIGKAPAGFTLKPAPVLAVVPSIPLGLPSDLLERRPDIAAAERRMAAANAQIGVAKAAWFPALTFSGAGGYESNSFSNWLNAPSRFWSFGPALALTLFDAGARNASIDVANAAYDQTVATYRETVLSGLQDVEDNLISLRLLESEANAQDAAAEAARDAARQTMNQYQAGTSSYLDVITTEATALNNERSALTIKGRRLTAAVLLIKALGGGWEQSKKDIPLASATAAASTQAKPQ